MRQLLQRLTEKANTTAVKVSKAQREETRREAAATEDCKDLLPEYGDRLNKSVTLLLEGGLGVSGATVNTTMQELSAILRTVTEAFSVDHRATLQTHRSSHMVRIELPRAFREIATDVLLPVFHSIVQSMLEGSIQAFDERALQVPGSPELPKLLSLLSSATTKAFNTGLANIRKEFIDLVRISAMVTGSVEAGLTATAAPRKAARFISWLGPSELPQFDASFEKRRLNFHMQQFITERTSELFLDGSYNPYVRTSPLPPLQVNVNFYAPDVRGMIQNWELSRLYDDPIKGPCIDRADPLFFKGVAVIPFNPNELPVLPKRPFWKSVKSFF